MTRKKVITFGFLLASLMACEAKQNPVTATGAPTPTVNPNTQPSPHPGSNGTTATSDPNTSTTRTISGGSASGCIDLSNITIRPITQPTQEAGTAATPAPIRKSTSMGIGLGGIADWSNEFPFLDLVKSSRDWQDIGDLSLDANGWVKSLKTGQHAEMFFLSIGKEPLPFHRFVVRYKGKGKVVYNLAAKKDDAASIPGRDVINIANEEGSYGVLSIEETDPNDYIRDITVVPEQYVSLYDAGEIFNPLWLDVIKDFRAFRFMDWMSTNNNTLVQTWNDRPKMTDRSWANKGVPVEVMTALANKMNADPWFNMPHLSDEDYQRRFAQQVKAELAPHLVAHVEHSNEVWNWGFQQAQYANTTGRALWASLGEDKLGDAFIQWHGMRTAKMCDIWKDVFADNKKRVFCILGVQTAWMGLEQGALNCPNWKEGAPCSKHNIDALAVTGYFSGCLQGMGGEWNKYYQDQWPLVESWFNEPDKGLTKGMEQIATAKHYKCDDITASAEGLRKQFKYYNTLTSSLGMKVVAYEGGSHVTGNGHPKQDNQKWIDFHIALNRDPRMKDRYLEVFNAFKEEGGTLFMHFIDVAGPSKYGSWGMIEYLGQPETPKQKAIKEFNAQTCWWTGCKD